MAGATESFRTEVRDWLAAHVPAAPLPSMDTAAGFERHREWERELAAAGLAVVSWPAAYGGRGASLLDWLAFGPQGPRAGRSLGLGRLAPRARHGRAREGEHR
jgi:alkylation response protein AidB-like acyl-CoA dehydrogenase